MGKRIFDDVTSGQVKLRDSLKNRGLRAVRGVARRTTTRGGGRIKKKKKKRKQRRERCYKKDVFA